jgi:hypothetical protein
MNAAAIVLAAARNTAPCPALVDDSADYSPVYLADCFASCAHLLTRAEFDAAALELWYADKVELTRADHVPFFDTAKVEASELVVAGVETLHFIKAS